MPVFSIKKPRRFALPFQPDGLTPYLGLQARLSQLWINRWTVVLLLVLARVLFAISSLSSDVSSAKQETLSSCSTVETAGSTMASMPHYMAQGVNDLTSKDIEEAVKGLEQVLLLTATGVEEMALFFIRAMYSSYLSLITFAVRGSAEVAASLLEDASNSVNKTVQGIANDINSTSASFDNDLNGFLSKLNGAASISGGPVPSVNLTTQTSELRRGIRFPVSIDNTIESLNGSLPNFLPVANITMSILSTPFEEVKSHISQYWGSYSFDRSVLPVPSKKQLTFCHGADGLQGFFDDVSHVIGTAKKTFIGVLVVLAFFVCIPLAWNEINRWRTMKERSQLVHKEALDPIDVVYIVSRPYTAGAGVKLASRFSDNRKQILIRWTIAYATTATALFVLFVGLAWLFACLCQYLLLQSLKQHAVPDLTQHIDDFSGKVIGSLQKTSLDWANDANRVINNVSDDVNSRVIDLVGTSTAALNDSFNSFFENTTRVLNATIGGTLLSEPMQNVLAYFVLLKGKGIESGLAWARQNTRISLPVLPNDTFSINLRNDGNQKQISVANSTSGLFASGSGDDQQLSDKISQAIARVVDKFESSIRTEAIVAFVIVLVWVAILLFGILRAIALYWRHERTRGEGGGPRLDPTRADNGCSYYNNKYNPDSSADLNDGSIPLAHLRRDRDHELRGYPETDAAPRYEVATRSPGMPGPPSAVQLYDGELGYAGQRNYASSLTVNHPATSASSARARFESAESR